LIGRELSHSRGCEQFHEVPPSPGFRLNLLRRCTGFLSVKILTPRRLRDMVGVERINELCAEITLGSGRLRQCEARARALYEWRFAEEIEHQSVAFDIYQATAGNRFWLGCGVVMAYLVNMSYWRWPVPPSCARTASCSVWSPGIAPSAASSSA
jgi:predicted metal-dependent hydrolase